jgi:antitoxin YefM
MRLLRCGNYSHLFSCFNVCKVSLILFSQKSILFTMRTATATKVKISKLLAESEKSHEPIQIVGKNAAGVLVSADDWSAIQETLYLLSIPKMRESIIRGLKTPVENFCCC